mmetsp:Transcript_64654/g.94705  ORF Transcript_64654/g.94705 Transcript_64654/m.94705 type:complete len:97 (+) Transcript_64654:943-1233(+)
MTEDSISFECIYSLKDWMKSVKFALEFVRKDSDTEVKENWSCKVRMKIRKGLEKQIQEDVASSGCNDPEATQKNEKGVSQESKYGLEAAGRGESAV